VRVPARAYRIRTPPRFVKAVTLAHYELGRLRIAVAMLSPLAKALGVTVEELMGEETPPAKRGPAPKLLQQIERIQRLPRTQQRFVMQMLDTVLAQASR